MTRSACRSHSFIFHLHYKIPILRRFRNLLPKVCQTWSHRLNFYAVYSSNSTNCILFAFDLPNTDNLGLTPAITELQVTPQNTGVPYIPRPAGWPSPQLAINTADHQDTYITVLSLMHDWLTRFTITVTVLKLRHGRFIRVVQTRDAYGLSSRSTSQELRLGTSHITR